MGKNSGERKIQEIDPNQHNNYTNDLIECPASHPRLVDLFNAAMSGTSVFSPAIDCGVLIGVSAVFIFTARVIQTRNLVKGL